MTYGPSISGSRRQMVGISGSGNNLSTIVSQLLDSVVFMFLAFYRLTPELDVVAVLQMIMPLWTLKVGFALLDTPFVYLGVRWLACENESRGSDSGESRETGLVEVEAGSMPEKSLDSEISVWG